MAASPRLAAAPNCTAGEAQYKQDAEKYFDESSDTQTQELGELKPLTAVLMSQVWPRGGLFLTHTPLPQQSSDEGWQAGLATAHWAGLQATGPADPVWDEPRKTGPLLGVTTRATAATQTSPQTPRHIPDWPLRLGPRWLAPCSWTPATASTATTCRASSTST